MTRRQHSHANLLPHIHSLLGSCAARTYLLTSNKQLVQQCVLLFLMITCHSSFTSSHMQHGPIHPRPTPSTDIQQAACATMYCPMPAHRLTSPPPHDSSEQHASTQAESQQQQQQGENHEAGKHGEALLSVSLVCAMRCALNAVHPSVLYLFIACSFCLYPPLYANLSLSVSPTHSLTLSQGPLLTPPQETRRIQMMPLQCCATSPSLILSNPRAPSFR